MDIVTKAFQYGQIARNQGDYSQAVIHFTTALEIFHSTFGSDYDLSFWARILFSRAEAYLLYGHYSSVQKDVKQALSDCPQQCHDLVSCMHTLFVIRTNF